MDYLVLFVVGALAAAALVYYLGKKEGSATEQRFVAEVLAKYRQVDAAAAAAVNSLLGSLKADYVKAYIKVVDEIDQIAAKAKKAL